MAWYDPSWTYRVKVTVDHTKVAADLTDFPVYVNLANLPSGFFTNVKSDGGDIRVTTSNGTTEVPREVVAISTGGSTGELHFKASGTLSSSSDTFYYIYYGNSGASEPAVTATYGRNNVWTDYAAVFHMNQDPSGTAPQMIDSTGTYSGTSAGTMTSADLVSGKIGNGIDFDGTNDEIDIGTTPHFSNATAMTWSCWANPTGTLRCLMAKGTNSSPYEGVNFFSDSGTVKLSFVPSTGLAGQIVRGTGGSSYNDGTLRLLTATYAGDNSASSIHLYANGSADDGTASGTWSGSQVTTRRLKIAERDGGLNGNNIIDEVRMRFAVLSSNWISTEYNNQNSPSTFYTVGTQETDTGTPEYNAIFFGANF